MRTAREEHPPIMCSAAFYFDSCALRAVSFSGLVLVLCPDAPVNRVTVTSDLVLPESPSPISPPNQIEEIRRVAISPPLHSKKMAEHENPFRPEEVLYHEVDPIVEQYMHKPFPPSRPGSAHNTPTKQQKESSLSSPAYLQNGLSKEQLMDNEKAQTQPLLDADQRQSSPEKK
ncbi:hypothetical protein ANCCAN_23061 [Ancylostoma caninum]|uniref:Uncharacterized protein n=1 Tax=Ancylostoma caninum TaxID=29170 RepID=A0A368FG39_ANCCA|nr:hypothetical protein ANCCAN_23061 [Ancylostoma caninum]